MADEAPASSESHVNVKFPKGANDGLSSNSSSLNFQHDLLGEVTPIKKALSTPFSKGNISGSHSSRSQSVYFTPSSSNLLLDDTSTSSKNSRSTAPVFHQEAFFPGSGLGSSRQLPPLLLGTLNSPFWGSSSTVYEDRSESKDAKHLLFGSSSLSPRASATRAWINYPTLVIIYVLFKIFFFLTNIQVAFGKISAKTAKLNTYLEKRIGAIQSLLDGIFSFVRLHLFRNIFTFIEILENVALLFYQILGRCLNHSLGSVVFFINCIGNLLEEPPLLELPSPDFKISKDRAVSFSIRQFVPSNHKLVSEAPSIQVSCEPLRHSFDYLWYFFASMSVILTIVLFFMNIYFIIHAHRNTRNLRLRTSEFFFSWRQRTSLATLEYFIDTLLYPAKPHLKKFAQFFCCCFTPSKINTFVDYVVHEPSWFCMELGFLGLIFCLLQLVLLTFIQKMSLEALTNYFKSNMDEAITSLDTALFIQVNSLQGDLKVLFKELPDITKIDFGSFSNLIEATTAEILGFFGQLSSVVLKEIHPDCLCLLLPSSLITAIRVLSEENSKFSSLIETLRYNSSNEHPMFLQLKKALYAFMEESTMTEFVYIYLENLTQSIYQEAILFGLVFLYGSLIIWQGILYAFYS